ncbi:MAG TPA: hypothetical protein VNU26_18145 [Mycobacteriales bacterium]|nr:hypothetical protein [Mycobacteriales bacterium]
MPAGLLERLPATTPPPPWHCRVRATVWVQRTPSPLPPGAPFADRARGVTVGALVEYLDSPVGRYSEIFAGPLLRGAVRPVMHVPFIAVDSVPSVHGGRAHWSLPKTLARFDGDVHGRSDVHGDGWSVVVRAAPLPVPVPVVGTLVGAQVAGVARAVLRGRGRAARVRVDAAGPTLSGWLGAGTHAGVVGTGRMVVHAARPAQPPAPAPWRA